MLFGFDTPRQCAKSRTPYEDRQLTDNGRDRAQGSCGGAERARDRISGRWYRARSPASHQTATELTATG